MKYTPFQYAIVQRGEPIQLQTTIILTDQTRDKMTLVTGEILASPGEFQQDRTRGGKVFSGPDGFEKLREGTTVLYNCKNILSDGEYDFLLPGNVIAIINKEA